MDFKEFANRMETELRDILQDSTGGGITVALHSVEKMQGQSYTALTVTPEGSNIGMNVNLDALYAQMQHGATFDEVLDMALDQTDTFLGENYTVDVKSITDYEQVRPKLFVEVVDAERNAAMLGRIPHTDVEDMAMVYRLELQQTDQGLASVLVTNDLLNQFGITAEQLQKDAMENSAALRPVTIRPLSEILGAMTGMEPEDVGGSNITVVSNAEMLKGASAIFYPGVMDQCAEQVGGNFFMLPSSVHEVLLVPDDGQASLSDLEGMVSSINQTEVSPADVLTDHVYHYDAQERIFERGDKFEARQAEKEMASQERHSVMKDLMDRQKEISLAPKVAGSRAKADLVL